MTNRSKYSSWRRRLPQKYAKLEKLVEFTNLLRAHAIEDKSELLKSQPKRGAAQLWKKARARFPMDDGIGISLWQDAALVKCFDGRALMEAMLQLDACLREVAARAVEETKLPFELPHSRPGWALIQIMSDGKVKQVRDRIADVVLDAILDADLDVRRLKICPICERLLVTERYDRIACGGKCSATERQRRLRDPLKRKKYRELIRKRRAVRAREERAKQCAWQRVLQGEE